MHALGPVAVTAFGGHRPGRSRYATDLEVATQTEVCSRPLPPVWSSQTYGVQSSKQKRDLEAPPLPRLGAAWRNRASTGPSMGCALKLPTGAFFIPPPSRSPSARPPCSTPVLVQSWLPQGPAPGHLVSLNPEVLGTDGSGREQGSEYLRSGQAVPGDLAMLGTRKSLEPNNWPNQLP